jgi:hypothetical protein
MIKKYQYSIKLIRPVLLQDWNPISDNVPNDEYDSYIPQMYEFLINGDKDGLILYLKKVEVEYMGYNVPNDERINKTVIKLFELVAPITGE